MRITAGPAIYCESYGKFASEFSTKNSTNNLTPAQVFAKYNVKDMSNIDQSHMLLDFWSSSDPESGYVGMNMGFDIMEHNIVNSLNGVTESPTQRYNLLSSAEDSYKKEISGGGAAADYYLKLCKYLSQASGQVAG